MIFYLSCTGNTLWAARRIAEATGESLVNIAKAETDGDLHYPLAPGERIGFCFPVHGWRPPKLVRDFVHRLVIQKAEGHFCWALCTAGDDIGLTMEYLNRDLREKGLEATSLFSLIMPESYVGLPFMDVDKPDREREKKETARQALETFIPAICKCEKGITRTYRGHWPRTNSHVLGHAFVKWLVTDKPFQVDSRACTRCGTCASVCPVNDIQGGAGLSPEWKHNGRCLTCFSCYHHCPTRAIQYGKRTQGKGQYYFGNRTF